MHRLVLINVAAWCADAPQAVTRRLSHLAAEVLAAKQRSKALTAESPGMATPGNTGGIGSVEHTLKVGALPLECAACLPRYAVKRLVIDNCRAPGRSGMGVITPTAV